MSTSNSRAQENAAIEERNQRVEAALANPHISNEELGQTTFSPTTPETFEDAKNALILKGHEDLANVTQENPGNFYEVMGAEVRALQAQGIPNDQLSGYRLFEALSESLYEGNNSNTSQVKQAIIDNFDPSSEVQRNALEAFENNYDELPALREKATAAPPTSSVTAPVETAPAIEESLVTTAPPATATAAAPIEQPTFGNIAGVQDGLTAQLDNTLGNIDANATVTVPEPTFDEPVQVALAPPTIEPPTRAIAAVDNAFDAGFAPLTVQGPGSYTQNDIVAEAQAKMLTLNSDLDMGSRDGKPDGYFGPATEASIKEQQIAMNMEPTGQITPDFLAAMDQQIALNQQLDNDHNNDQNFIVAGTGNGVARPEIGDIAAVYVNELGLPLSDPAAQAPANSVQPLDIQLQQQAPQIGLA